MWWARTIPCVLAVFCLSAQTGELRELVRRALNRLEENQERVVSNYAFRRAGERREYYTDGKLRSENRWVVERVLRDGFFFSKMVEREGQAVPEAEQKGNEEQFLKRAAELKAMTPEQLKLLREEERSKERREDVWLRELPDALEFRSAGEETINGRVAIVMDCSPRKGYRPKNIRARVFEKMKGRVWLDKADLEMVKAEAEMFDDVTIGWGLIVRIEKGTRFLLSRRKVGAETWAPETQVIKLSARVLFKSLRSEVVNRYSDYRHRSEISPAASAN